MAMLKAAAVLILLFTSGAAHAQDDKPDIPDPECDGGTADMVRCIDAVTAQWDKRLNAAYQEALKDATSREQREQLRKAQRLWVQYRDANCSYYSLGEGSISQLNTASCLFDMTKARAQELERGPEN